MITTTSADPNTILESARALRPLVESVRDEMEAQRRMPASLVQAMAGARLFHLFVPNSIGGLEVDPMTFMRVIEEVSAMDGSAGWNLMIGSGDGIIAGFVPEHQAQEVFGEPNSVVAGAIAPTGKAIAEDGGYRVTGRWKFGSGIHHSNWVGANCIVFDGDAPRMEGDAPVIRFIVVPAGEVEIHDVWYVSGLRGTGSEDFSITDVFVPEGLAVQLFSEKVYQDGPLYRMPITLFPATVAAIPLGIARAAIDALVDLATTKVPMRFGSVLTLRERATAQVAVAQAEALLGSARSYLYEALEEMWQTVTSGDPSTLEQRAKLRLASCHAATACAKAVDLMYTTGGGSSIFDRSLLQRCSRDVHAATQHVMVAAPNGMEDVGRVLLGLPSSSPLQ